jgi:NADH dehydrogenase/NADH:ubiquinone oxidoreductase subunit G
LKVPITIDGQMVQIDSGAAIIDAAKKAGVVIPTLCYHEALKPYGSCRLCMVEMIINKQRRLVTACNFPVEGGMEVFTGTAKLRQIRRMIIELLLARCPDVSSLHAMAKQMGIKSSRFKKQDSIECILCGLCVRFCEEVVGVSAIGLVSRGIDREVATPFKVASDVCIGCGSCTYICPAGCIEMVPDKKIPQMRTMKMGQHSLNACINEFQCETCSVEKEFFEDMRLIVAEFRSTKKSAVTVQG